MGLLLQNTADVHAGNAGNAAQFIRQRLVHKVAELMDIHIVGGDRRHHDRQHGRVDLQHIGRRHGVLPLTLQNGDLLLDIHADGVQIDPLFKLQRHHRGAVLAGRGHRLDVVQHGHGLFHGLGDLLLHRLGTGTGICGHDDDVGKVHIRQQVGGHLQIGHHAQHNNCQYRHEYGKRFFHAEFRHIEAPPCGDTILIV